MIYDDQQSHSATKTQEAIAKKMVTAPQLNLGGMVFLISTICAIYVLLLQDNNVQPFSILGMHSMINRCAYHWHIVVAGLLPIYIAVVIFGTAILSSYFGSALHRWVMRKIKRL